MRPLSLLCRARADEDTGVPDKLGWAFGLGLERIAMVLFSIPDIRLFWSTDARFLDQFKADEITTFKSYSKYPECYKDLSLWVPSEGWHENDFCEVVRDCAGDLVEGVELVRFSCSRGGRELTMHRLTSLFIPRRGGGASATDSTTARWTGAFLSSSARAKLISWSRSLSNEEVNELQAQVVEQVVEQIGRAHV